MELDDLQKIWMDIDQKLDRNWKLNLEIIKKTNLDKAKRKMNKLIWVIAITLAFYSVFAFLFVRFAVINWTSPHLAATGIILAVWTLLICVGAVHELEVISRVDYADPVTDLQKQLAKVRVLILRYLRIAAWILPFNFVFVMLFFKVIFGIDIVANAPTNWLIWNLVISVVLFLPLTIWIHRKLDPKHIDKKWMQALLKGNGSQISDAIDFIREIDEFEQEKPTPL